MLHATIQYRHVLDSFVASFNGLNPSYALERIEDYEWRLIIALKNVLLVSYSSTIILTGYLSHNYTTDS